MTKKQKKMLYRIIAALALVLVLKLLPPLPTSVELLLYCIPYSYDLLCIIVVDLDIKCFFNSHNNLENIQGIRSQIIYKGRLHCNFIFVYVQNI